MAGRLRVGPASRQRALILMAATVLLAALVLTGRLLDGGGSPPELPARGVAANPQAPHRIGGKVECPPAWPVLVMSNHTSYPAGHPARPPPDATPVACYQTTAQAISAGYPSAPLPGGTLEVFGVYLSQPSRTFRGSCQRAADRLGFAVPCPGLLPTPAPGTAQSMLCGESAICRRGQLLAFTQDGFVVPFGYAGAIGGYGALSIVAMPTAAEPDRLRCPSEHVIATPTVHRIRAVLATCPKATTSVLGGSVLVHWSERRTRLEVSTPGAGEVNQLLVIAIADHVRLVEPTGSRSPESAVQGPDGVRDP
jgi:hypothetical protein